MTTKSLGLGRIMAIIAILLGVFLGGCAERNDGDTINNYPGGGGNPPPVNRAPTFVPVANFTVQVNTPANFHVTATDPDADSVNLTWTVPTGATFINVINDQTTVSGDFRWTPTTVGTYTASFTATDEHGLAATLTVTITVTLTPPPNDPPVFDPVATVYVQVNTATTFHVRAVDPNNDTVGLTWTIPSGATFTNVVNNAAIVSGDFSWTPTIEGTYGADFTATDEHGLVATLHVAIVVSVTPVNHPPIFDPVNTVTVQVNTATTFHVRAVDPDNDIVDLTWAIPSGASFNNVVDNATTVSGDFSWTPTSIGSYSAVFTGTDEHGLATTLTVNIIVTTEPPPPNNSYIGIDWAYFDGIHQASIHWDCGYPPDPTEPWHIAATVIGHDAATGNSVREFPNPAAMVRGYCWANIHVIDEALNVCTPSGATDPLTDHWFPTGNNATGMCYSLPPGSPHFYYFDGTTQYDLNFSLVDNGVGGSVFEINTAQGTPPGGDVPIDLSLLPDVDGDTIPNFTDNCQIIINTDQLDANTNGIGDVCEGIDSDNDGTYDWDE